MNTYSTKNQHGVALIMFAVVLVLIITTVYISRFEVNSTKQMKKNSDTEVLAQAKEALLNFAATWGYTNAATLGDLGFLPCPDEAGNGEGNSALNCGNKHQSIIGQLPWHTLRIQPLKNSSGDCLWYAVSGEYKNANTRTDMLNEDTNGSFNVYAEDGVTMLHSSNPEDRIVAIVIDPGLPLTGQVRNPVAGTICGEDFNAADYLDNHNGISNQSVTLLDDMPDNFITTTGESVAGLNDHIITISQKEVFDRITNTTRFKNLMLDTTYVLAQCLAEYGKSNPGNNGTPCPQVCSVCRNQCDTTYDCNSLPPGPGRGQCAQNRAQCRQSCRNNGCVNSLPPNCGVGTTDYRLSWAAALDLNNSDYRVSNNYVQVASVYYGRFPQIGPGGTDLFANCTSLTARNGVTPVNLNDTNDLYRELWENWKDHFFLAVSQDFDQNKVPPTVCSGDCIRVSGDTTDYAAMVIYSGTRLSNQAQLRYAAPPEQTAPVIADSKADISNYLEGSNATVYPDTSGNGTYGAAGVAGAIGRDIAFCIDQNMNVSTTQCQ